ncbi:hypothetical protein [Pseudomonas fluorescens]|uniref:hypothetical protein n=1 Tax=Pseudomonas fluorescens TaxID=294 RepID=UPI00123FE86A|nr:hypothetical protein [Pseudomonas fluorescens]VVO85151.1 hypothetical protein PS898_02016 [Pseudomonas fluorescens]
MKDKVTKSVTTDGDQKKLITDAEIIEEAFSVVETVEDLNMLLPREQFHVWRAEPADREEC